MSASTKSRPLRVFISYTHSDEKLKDELRAHLAPQRRAGLLADWHDRDIGAGQEWKNAIDANLERAHIILLLISARFLNSAYCMDVEMKRALQRHEEGKTRVIPIILRPCDWHSTQFAKLQGLPTDGRPVLKWRSHDEAWTVVAKEIGAAARQFRSSTPAMRRKQNRQAAANAAPAVAPDRAVKTPPSPSAQRPAPAAPSQAVPVKSGHARVPKSAAAPATPVDSAPLIKRARSLVVSERNNYYGNGNLQVIVVGGPLQQVLRPSQIEQNALRLDLEQKSLYGTVSILTPGAKTESMVEKGVLRIAQQEASLRLAEDGALAIIQPARLQGDSSGFAFPAIIEEDVTESIRRALRFAGMVLNKIDRTKRLTALAVVAALDGIGHSPWRTRAEQAASANASSMTLGRGLSNAVVVELDHTISRAALALQIPAAAEDLMTLIRREVRGK